LNYTRIFGTTDILSHDFGIVKRKNHLFSSFFHFLLCCKFFCLSIVLNIDYSARLLVIVHKNIHFI